MFTNWDEVPLTLRAEQVAEIVGLSRSTVHRLIKAGRIRSVRVSERRILISKEAVREFLGDLGAGSTPIDDTPIRGLTDGASGEDRPAEQEP